MTPSVAIQDIPQHPAKPGLRKGWETSPSVETRSKLHVGAHESQPTPDEKTGNLFSWCNSQDDVNKPEPTPQETPKLDSSLGSQRHSRDVRKPGMTTSLTAEVHPARESVRTLWQSDRIVRHISPQHLSPDDVVIAVMGPSGAGKSSFIEVATGAPNGVGHSLESCTVEISATKVTIVRKLSISCVVFVDTPGFEAEGLSDSDILGMIAQWLKRSHHQNIKLSGILYLRRISDNRMTGTPLKNHRIFHELCGTDALQHVVLTTTMWDHVQDGEGDDREKELCETYWKTMTQQGSTVARFLGTMESAWSVIEPFLLEATERLAARESVRTLWKSGRRVQSILPEHLSPDDVIIAVMGPTGAGRSSFIEAATGVPNTVGHNLESFTTEISATKVTFLEKRAFGVVFVDTPGFDETNDADSKILEMISQWLKGSCDGNIRLSGILYLQRISDNRVAGTPLKNLSIFHKLCGKDALQRIILTTTMWDDVQIRTGDQREKELCAGYWKAMAEQGSKVARFLHTTESAWNVVEPILLDANRRCAVEIEHEMVDLKKRLSETRAGKQLYIRLDRLVQMQREMLQRIGEESEKTGDERFLSQLKSEYDEVRKNIGATIADMQVLKLPLRTRLIRMLLWPLGLFVKGIMK